MTCGAKMSSSLYIVLYAGNEMPPCLARGGHRALATPRGREGHRGEEARLLRGRGGPWRTGQRWVAIGEATPVRLQRQEATPGGDLSGICARRRVTREPRHEGGRRGAAPGCRDWRPVVEPRGAGWLTATLVSKRCDG
jgi:hypothetical protein